MLLSEIGEAGQARLRAASALLVGCGALGSTLAELLVRAGIGRLVLVDRDLVELTNLQRQTLYDESDAREGLPKAAAAKRRLAAINSQVTLDAVVADYAPANAVRLSRDVDVLLDGTDNFQTRFLLNDVAVKLGKPYVYGGAVGTRGMVYTLMPGRPCMRCLFDDAPPAGVTETCDTRGVLGPITSLIAAMQAAEAIKLLTGNEGRIAPAMVSIDLWHNTFKSMNVGEPLPDCPCCALKRFDHLDGARGSGVASLCGRNAVQITADRADSAIDLPQMATRLASHGRVMRNEYLLRADLAEHGRDYQLTLFSDGRAIVHGTADPAVARSLYSRYIGL
ncbi:MAG: thiazole biosynthesis adenylyltransferase ThiF [Planctomycetes bacterium]|nr:thiazole biosynthesis adenylyltransferase ThiF [Planctomycetota bacterium]